MREQAVLTLLLLLLPHLSAQTVPADWKVVRDSKSACQIAVPPEWAPWGDNTGAAVFQNTTTAIAVVTSQPGQAFKPLSDQMQKLLGIRKEAMFENTAKRVFYQDKTSARPEDSNAYLQLPRRLSSQRPSRDSQEDRAQSRPRTADLRAWLEPNTWRRLGGRRAPAWAAGAFE